MCCSMVTLKHIHSNSILGTYFHDKLTHVNPRTCQNRDSNHCIFMTVTVIIINDRNLVYKFDEY